MATLKTPGQQMRVFEDSLCMGHLPMTMATPGPDNDVAPRRVRIEQGFERRSPPDARSRTWKRPSRRATLNEV
jgi:hypothetical protein